MKSHRRFRSTGFHFLSFRQNESLVIMSGIYTHPDLIAGSILKFRLYGISESYHNYMKLLLNASSGSNNGPFQVTPTLVKGNIKNETDPKDLIFGYFRLGETAEYSYTIQ